MSEKCKQVTKEEVHIDINHIKICSMLPIKMQIKVT